MLVVVVVVVVGAGVVVVVVVVDFVVLGDFLVVGVSTLDRSNCCKWGFN